MEATYQLHAFKAETTGFMMVTLGTDREIRRGPEARELRLASGCKMAPSVESLRRCNI